MSRTHPQRWLIMGIATTLLLFVAFSIGYYVARQDVTGALAPPWPEPLTRVPHMLAAPTAAMPGDAVQIFPQTGKKLKGVFLDYWNTHGSLTQQGYPISDAIQERSDVDGKLYMVQYFEQALLEYHPESQTPNNVLPAQLGTLRYRAKYPNGAPGQQPNTAANSLLFAETGKRLGGKFLDYWNTHGSLTQQGYPISDEFMEQSDLNGETYRVQYFERTVIELHPGDPPPLDVLPAQLGTLRYKEKYLIK